MAQVQSHGCLIEIIPAAHHDEEGNEDGTCWEYVVTLDGQPLPIVVESCDRKEGLRETKKAIRRYLARIDDGRLEVSPEMAG